VVSKSNKEPLLTSSSLANDNTLGLVYARVHTKQTPRLFASHYQNV